MRRALVILLVLSVLAGACADDASEEGGGLVDKIRGESTSDDDDPANDDDPADDGDDDPIDGSGAIDWVDAGGGWQEGTLAVPLDHDDPDGETIDISVVRHPAENPDERIGPLLINPGGPGAAGIEYAYYSELVFADEIMERFDIIGFDPRGVATSTPVTCGDDAYFDEYAAADPVPDGPDETATNLALVEEFADNCEAESGDILPHLDTVSTAKDMDLIREALGDDQITYLGFSYGTYLGATYLELFGDRTRAAVLDGAYSRSLTPAEMTEGQAVGFERTLDAFLDWCRSVTCDYSPNGDPEATLTALLTQVDERPLPAGDRQLTVGHAWTGLLQALYGEVLWPGLDRALAAAAIDKDGTELLALADQYNDRSLDGSYGNSTSAFNTISCMDSPPIDEVDQAAVAAQVVAVAPRVGPVFTAMPGPCSFWPIEHDPPTGPWSAPDAPPVLVIATTGDPATPYEWGVRAADELETSTLLSVEGDSHTAYWGGNSCVDDLVDAYILDLAVPDEGARC
jgi:pimeloyl-ACP methyl ester carboxylesterase